MQFVLQSLLTVALEWLADARARPGAVGEKAIRRILDVSGHTIIGVVRAWRATGQTFLLHRNCALA